MQLLVEKNCIKRMLELSNNFVFRSMRKRKRKWDFTICEHILWLITANNTIVQFCISHNNHFHKNRFAR